MLVALDEDEGGLCVFSGVASSCCRLSLKCFLFWSPTCGAGEKWTLLRLAIRDATLDTLTTFGSLTDVGRPYENGHPEVFLSLLTSGTLTDGAGPSRCYMRRDAPPGNWKLKKNEWEAHLGEQGRSADLR